MDSSTAENSPIKCLFLFSVAYLIFASSLFKLLVVFISNTLSNFTASGCHPTVSPGLREFGECCQAAGVHVPPNIDVNGGVGLGELRRRRDALGGHWRHR